MSSFTSETLRASFAVGDTVFYSYKEYVEYGYYHEAVLNRDGYGSITEIDYENLKVNILKVDSNATYETTKVIFDFKTPGRAEFVLKKGFRPGQIVEYKDVCEIASLNGDEITLTNGKTFNRRNLKQVENS
jgi:hypothetical protein